MGAIMCWLGFHRWAFAVSGCHGFHYCERCRLEDPSVDQR